MTQQTTVPKPLVIANATVRQDGDGRCCLNDLHQASGAAMMHKPGIWLALVATQALIQELDMPDSAGAKPLCHAASGIGEGRPAIFVCQALVYAYALWVSPVFFAKIYRCASGAAKSGAEIATDDVMTHGLSEIRKLLEVR